MSTSWFSNIWGVCVTQSFFVGSEWIAIYNSIGLSEAPTELWDVIDAQEVAQEYQAGNNKPHWWQSDRATLEFGEDVLSISDIGFRFAAKLPWPVS